MRTKNYATKNNSNFETAEFALGYLYRNVEEQLNHFSATNGGKVPIAVAAGRLGELLLAKARGQLLDGAEHLPKMRRTTTRRHAIAATEKEVYVRSRNNGALKFPHSPVRCNTCGKVSKNRQAYMIHMNKKHNNLMKIRIKKMHAAMKAKRLAAQSA